MKVLACLACLVATTSIAAAQPPSLTAPAPAPAPEPETQSYVAAGATYGGERGLYIAGTVEAGHRLGRSPLWVRGMIVTGRDYGFDEPTFGPGSILQARAGLEARGCLFAGAACAVAGVDVAASYEHYMAEYDQADSTEVMPIARVGLDLGTSLRVRPAVELGPKSFGLTGALAYQW